MAYAAPIILLPLWLILKLIWFIRGNGWGFVKIDSDVGELADTLRRLRYKKRDETTQGDEMGGRKSYMMANNISRTDNGSASDMLSSTVSPITEAPPHGPVSSVEHHFQQGLPPHQQYQPYMQPRPYGTGQNQQGYM